MSFRDLESGLGLPLEQRQSLYLKNSSTSNRNSYYDKNKAAAAEEPSRLVAAGIFQLQTAVSSFYRLVNSLGTPKDTLQLRDTLHKTRTHIGQLVKDISAKLKEASEFDHDAQVSVVKKIADAKLAKNFQAALKDFQKAQRLAAERETSYAPSVPKPLLPSSYSIKEQEMSSARSPKQQALLQESETQGILLSDNEIAFNEAIIEEREQGIQEIQQQIGEVNEIFKDLAVLVQDQGALIDDFSSNIENTHSATAQAASQLSKASKLQKSNSSLTCLLLVIFGIIVIIVIIVVVA